MLNWRNISSQSASTHMLWALGLGTLTGLFFGEMIAWMGSIGTAVVMLMQMTIYPYILVSLISGIGKLNKEDAKKLFSRAGVVMLVLWIIGIIVILLTPISFPTVVSASFFSTSEIAPQANIDYLKLYIPANPFESMSSGAVPAVVLFSIALGISLMSINSKDGLLDVMSTTAEGLGKISQAVVKILPIGIFTMSANMAGTISLQEFASLQVFLLVYILLCFLLTFGVLPYFLSRLTPLTHKEIIQLSWPVLITAFTTGNIFICLPVIMAQCKELLEHHGHLNKDSESLIDVLLPIAFSFPNIGKLTVILFIFFAGWFIGKPVNLEDYPMIAASGLLSLFGSVYVAIPFLLSSVHLPTDLNQLFVVSSFITGRFNSLVAAMNLVIFCVMSVFVIEIGLQNLKRNLLRFTLVSLTSVVAIFFVSRLVVGLFISGQQDTDSALRNMIVTDTVPALAFKEQPDIPDALSTVVSISTIKQRGVLRIGYKVNNVPFTYFNQQEDLVGVDVALAYQLASDLDVEVDFIPYTNENLVKLLNRGYFDFAMSGLEIDAELMEDMTFSDPVMILNLALVGRDSYMKELRANMALTNTEITVAYVQHHAMIKRVRSKYPKVTFVQLDDYQDFFTQQHDYHALLTSAEAGSAWSLFYPDYGVAILRKDDNSPGQFPVAFGVARRNSELKGYINNWIAMKKTYGHIDEQYRYWIEGKGAVSTEPRWSIIRNVLGWVE